MWTFTFNWNLVSIPGFAVSVMFWCDYKTACVLVTLLLSTCRNRAPPAKWICVRFSFHFFVILFVCMFALLSSCRLMRNVFPFSCVWFRCAGSEFSTCRTAFSDCFWIVWRLRLAHQIFASWNCIICEFQCVRYACLLLCWARHVSGISYSYFLRVSVMHRELTTQPLIFWVARTKRQQHRQCIQMSNQKHCQLKTMRTWRKLSFERMVMCVQLHYLLEI